MNFVTQCLPALATMLLASPAGGDANDVRLAAFMTTRFERVERLADLPEGVRAGLDSALGGEAMAEPGAAWNEGCVQDERPGQRLIFAGGSAQLWFIFFEQGGFARHQRMITLQKRPNGAYSKEGDWQVQGWASTVEELKAVVRESAHGRPVP